MTTYVSPKEAKAIAGVSLQTLRRWAKFGKINHYRTPGGQFRYDLASVIAKMATKVQPVPKLAAPVIEKPVSRPVEAPPAVVSIPEAPRPRMDHNALRRAFGELAMASSV